MVWKKRLAEEGISAVGDHSMVSVEPAGNGLVATLVSDLTGVETRVEAETVVVETGVRPVDEVFEALRLCCRL